MPAAAALDEAPHGVVPLPGALLLAGSFSLFDEVGQQARVLRLPQQHAIGGQPVAAGAARFLVKLLDGFRQRGVDHGAHRRLVDPQPEGDGAHQHAHFVVHPALLVAAAVGGLHLAVIGDGGDAPVRQKIHGLFHRGDGGRVHDHAFALVGAQGRQQQARVRLFVALVRHVAQVGAVEAGDVLVRIAQPELFQNVVPHAPGGAGGERGDGLIGEVLAAAS